MLKARPPHKSKAFLNIYNTAIHCSEGRVNAFNIIIHTHTHTQKYTLSYMVYTMYITCVRVSVFVGVRTRAESDSSALGGHA